MSLATDKICEQILLVSGPVLCPRSFISVSFFLLFFFFFLFLFYGVGSDNKRVLCAFPRSDVVNAREVQC